MSTRLFDPTQVADMPTRLFDSTQADMPARPSDPMLSRAHRHCLTLSLKVQVPLIKLTISKSNKISFKTFPYFLPDKLYVVEPGLEPRFKLMLVLVSGIDIERNLFGKQEEQKKVKTLQLSH